MLHTKHFETTYLMLRDTSIKSFIFILLSHTLNVIKYIWHIYFLFISDWVCGTNQNQVCLLKGRKRKEIHLQATRDKIHIRTQQTKTPTPVRVIKVDRRVIPMIFPIIERAKNDRPVREHYPWKFVWSRQSMRLKDTIIIICQTFIEACILENCARSFFNKYCVL